VDSLDVHDEIRADKERKRAYMSTLTARYNPDVLAGTTFLKGNEYFPVAKSKESDDEAGSASAKSQDELEAAGDDSECQEDLLEMMKK